MKSIFKINLIKISIVAAFVPHAHLFSMDLNQNTGDAEIDRIKVTADDLSIAKKIIESGVDFKT